MMKIPILLTSLLACSSACTSTASDKGMRIGQPSFQVCVNPIDGVTYDVRMGIDADSITAKRNHVVVKILIGGPASFADNPSIYITPPSKDGNYTGRKIVVPTKLAKSLSLIGVSDDTDRPNSVALYGYSSDRGVEFGLHDPVLVLLKVRRDEADLKLRNEIGKALYRCP